MNKRLAFAAAAVIALSAAPALAQSSKTAPPGTAATPATLATPADPGTSSATPATPSTGATPATPPSTSSDEDTSSTGAASASASGTNVSVTSGMSVKDNTGATIGSITDVRTDSAGRKTATIKMGADTFAVDTNVLAISGGAATVNASQAEIKTMLKKK